MSRCVVILSVSSGNQNLAVGEQSGRVSKPASSHVPAIRDASRQRIVEFKGGKCCGSATIVIADDIVFAPGNQNPAVGENGCRATTARSSHGASSSERAQGL